MKTQLTDKQYKIMVVICDGNGRDDEGGVIPVDMEELLDRLAYKTTKDSMQFSIRALVKNRLITKDYENRRGARRVVYLPTKGGLQLLRYDGSRPAFIEQDSDFLLAHAIEE